jgi:hypothetical protein
LVAATAGEVAAAAVLGVVAVTIRMPPSMVVLGAPLGLASMARNEVLAPRQASGLRRVQLLLAPLAPQELHIMPGAEVVGVARAAAPQPWAAMAAMVACPAAAVVVEVLHSARAARVPSRVARAVMAAAAK